jgi:hypothetical protein
MKQALEALVEGAEGTRPLGVVTLEAIIDLRQAIAEAEKQEPVAYWNGNSKFALPKAKEWDKRTGGTTAFGIDIPLYTHPQPKHEPPTDKDFLDWYDSAIWGNEDFKECCRIAFEAGWQAAHGIKGKT